MKILLCTPYSTSPEVTQGGITIWAHNMMEYYQTHNSNLLLKVIPYDRQKRGDNIIQKILQRTFYGFLDYRTPIKATIAEIESCRYDILHLCTSASISLLKDIYVLNVARRRGVKTVIHFHFGRIPEIQKKRNWEWWLLKKVVKLADAAITMDMKSYNTLKDYGFKNIHYLPNPLSNSIIQQVEDERNSIKRKQNKLCFVGHVIPTKGVYELIKACKDIKGITLQIIGKVSDDVHSKMEEIAGDCSWITFKGEIDHSLVIREMLSSDIFVLPTYTEGFPNVILEAMACGCAIVTTPVGAIPEILGKEKGKRYGLMVAPKDSMALKDAIMRMLNDKVFKVECVNNAQRRVNERYAMPKVWKEMVDIWKIAANM